MENTIPGAANRTATARPLWSLLTQAIAARVAVAPVPAQPETPRPEPLAPTVPGQGDEEHPVSRQQVYTVAALYLAAVSLAEFVTAAVEPQWGIPFHCVVMLLILFHGAVTPNVNLRNFIWVMSISPLIRVMSLTLPLSQLPFVWWYFVISIPLFASAFVLVRTIGYTRQDLYLEINNLRWQPLIMLIAFPLGVMEYLILRPQPLMAAPDFAHFVVPALILLVSTGFSEELIFRGIMQRATAPLMGTWPAAIYINLVFSVLHAGYLSFLDLVFVFVAGFIFSVFSIKTRSLFGVTIAHGIVNQLLFLIMPYTGIVPPTPR